MMKFVFHKDAFNDFTNWSAVNKNTFKRIAELLKDLSVTPYEEKGEPETVIHTLKGCWSRRITDEHRLVYRISGDNNIQIISCKGHYA